ncbi:hypothetical protein [Pedobacter mendelii]|uniref:DNA polymerase III psi subunit n=1 Tax=Pedobacter mendelii TaxID=1908240 RepID=A0ABQ2BBH6_9SPHI|nr:hypothetical protein [Pedobacter mendelii]GGI22281.1 hypothetical protein GCM10008119_01860 [Pedobacter mendelii]
MESQVTNNANALRLFFTEDVFLVEDNTVKIGVPANNEAVSSENMVEIVAVEKPVESIKILPLDDEKPKLSVNNYSENVEILLVAEEPIQSKVFKFLGGNGKSVLILVNDSVNDVSTEQGRELLRKIVKAIDLSTPDFALLNYANHSGTDYAELKQFFRPQLMLAFGVETNHLKLNFVWENDILIHEKTRMIFAPNLHDLDGNLAEKKALWAHLQKIK